LSEIRPSTNGDYVFGDLFAEAHAGVEMLGHDVGQAVVVDDLDADIRVARQ